MNANQISQILHSVPRLGPVAKEFDAGNVTVGQHQMDAGIQALYIAKAGQLEAEPNLSDAILLSGSRTWDFDKSIFDRSVLIHEAHHCLDDIDYSGVGTGHLASESRAWTAQAQYMALELAKGSDLVDSAQNLIAEIRSAGMGELECFCLRLGLMAAPSSPGLAAATQVLLEKLTNESSNLKGVDDLLLHPQESLPKALSLVYWTRPESMLEMDGVCAKKIAQA